MIDYDAKRARAARMVLRIMDGATLQAVGDENGISLERVRQLTSWVIRYAWSQGVTSADSAIDTRTGDQTALRELMQRLARYGE